MPNYKEYKFYPKAINKVRNYVQKEIDLSNEEADVASYLTSEDCCMSSDIGSRLATLKEILAVIIKESWSDRREENLGPVRLWLNEKDKKKRSNCE